MSSGITHRNDALVVEIVATISSLLVYVNTGSEYLSAGILIGGVCQFVVTPDIDHHIHTYEEKRWLKLLGVFGWLWIAYWWPYSKLFRHPNSKHMPFKTMSHMPLLGTVTRMIYLMWWIPMFFEVDLLIWIGCFAVWSVGDFIHIVRDTIF